MRFRFLISAVTMFFVMSICGAVFANSFDDVPRNHWAYDAVEFLSSKGLVEGYPDGTFRGDRTMSRYELAMIIARTYSKLESMAGNGTKTSIDVESIMNDLMDEFGSEIDEIRSAVKSNTSKIEDVERQLKENSEADKSLADKVAKLGSKFKFSGEMKLRYEGKFNDWDDSQANVPKFSYRFDMKADVNDEVSFEGRLGSNEGGKGSGPEVTFTDNFMTRAFEIERANLTYKPTTLPNWTFKCGKFDNVWQTPSTWFDSDFNVEGIAAIYKFDNWMFNISGMTPADKGLYLVAQIGAEDLLAKDFDAYLAYHHVSEGAWQFMVDKLKLWDARVDSDQYSAIEGYIKYVFQNGDWPIGFEASYRHMLEGKRDGLPAATDSALNQAGMAKVSFGKAKEVGDVDFFVQLSRATPNALIPQFQDSTYGNNYQTWSVGMTYKWMKNVDFKLKWDNVEYLVENPDRTYNKITADVVAKF